MKNALINNEPIQISNKIDRTQINKILRVSITLELFTLTQENLEPLINAGWIDNDYQPCPTMPLYSLETVLDYLGSPILFIDYLEKREWLENNIKYMGDEIDILSTYHDSLLSFESFGDKDIYYMLNQEFSLVNSYYEALSEGLEQTKPELPITNLWRGILKQLQSNNPMKGWTEIATRLLKVSPVEQVGIEKSIEELKDGVMKNHSDTSHLNQIIFTPNTEFMNTAICIILIVNANRHKSKQMIMNITPQPLSDPKIRQVVYIVINFDSINNYYESIGLIRRK